VSQIGPIQTILKAFMSQIKPIYAIFQCVTNKANTCKFGSLCHRSQIEPMQDILRAFVSCVTNKAITGYLKSLCVRDRTMVWVCHKYSHTWVFERSVCDKYCTSTEGWLVTSIALILIREGDRANGLVCDSSVLC